MRLFFGSVGFLTWIRFWFLFRLHSTIGYQRENSTAFEENLSRRLLIRVSSCTLFFVLNTEVMWSLGPAVKRCVVMWMFLQLDNGSFVFFSLYSCGKFAFK